MSANKKSNFAHISVALGKVDDVLNRCFQSYKVGGRFDGRGDSAAARDLMIKGLIYEGLLSLDKNGVAKVNEKKLAEYLKQQVIRLEEPKISARLKGILENLMEYDYFHLSPKTFREKYGDLEQLEAMGLIKITEKDFDGYLYWVELTRKGRKIAKGN
jgi:hypothetical protein